jgi:quinol---cytochrome c reductase cytochrome c subunit, bacillus type
VIAMMAYLTYLGAHARAPDQIETKAPTSLDAAQTKQYRAGEIVANQSGCGACHKFGEAGNATLGPNLTNIGSKLPSDAIVRVLENPTAPMPSYRSLPPKKFNDLVYYLSNLK